MASDRQAIQETTDNTTKRFRTYKTLRDGYCAADEFNRLGHHPPGPIVLPDGRTLKMTGWTVSSSLDDNDGQVKFSMTGFIEDTEEPKGSK